MNWITNLLSDKPSPPTTTDGLEQHEREAIIDALHYAMYCDHLLTRNENDVILNAKKLFTWEAVQPIDNFINVSAARTRLALGSDESNQRFFDRIITATRRPKAKRWLTTQIEKMIDADATRTHEESQILRKLR
ncbi:hypothetical protein N9B94_04040 [Verrucomicrobia bacterium]|nr:hypothetical protein [Verrucomicrobiota bacterium]